MSIIAELNTVVRPTARPNWQKKIYPLRAHLCKLDSLCSVHCALFFFFVCVPFLQVQCQRNLSWYQSVKETHGSVEATSFGQMTSMINYGRYVVGSILSAFQQTLGKIIRIELTEKDKALPKKHYTLEEIQDLESRLVLITGGDAAERKEVDEFLEVN